jgi:hypothetical protein
MSPLVRGITISQLFQLTNLIVQHLYKEIISDKNEEEEEEEEEEFV